MTMHCNVSQVDGQKELRKKNQIIYFVSLVQFLASSIKFLFQLTDLSMYLIQRLQAILLEQVGLFRNLQDRTVPISRPVTFCLWQNGIPFRKWKITSSNWQHSQPSLLRTESFPNEVYREVEAKPLSCRYDGPFKVNRQD